MSINGPAHKGQVGEPGHGGHFAHARHDDTDVLLAFAEQDKWGQVNIDVGSRTPWGAADSAEHVAPGLVIVGTGSHGGVKLSPERNAAIPAPLRNRSGWYNEDGERYIPEAFHADAYTKVRWGTGQTRTAEDIRTNALEYLRDQYPDQYEKATGESILPGQSVERDKQLWKQAHENDFVFAGSATAETEPDHVVVKGRVAATGETGEFLVPRSEYNTVIDRSKFIIDPTKYRQLPPKQDETPKGPVLNTYDLSGLASAPLTSPARSALEKDLRQRWRDADGNVRTLREIIERDGVTERTVIQEGGKRGYGLSQGSSFLRVSAATWKALDMIPDGRSESSKAYEKVSSLDARIEKAAFQDRQALRDKRAAAYEEYSALRETELAEERPRWEAAAEQKKAAQAARERAATIRP
ncbi:hypothetical protein [Curtobacterium sp. MCSS17_016]|uniref:DUF7007 domain-containing protein n=1 Tax=Curtobacterium sp. MCSS17_016 TaxID=2175644 RepID=UPI000DA8DC6E|nr:hypothetical protein [Curtobacterium sp. MCSS17_016]WIE81172.1 hypothetical protein DEJ19_018235 [Curtobacterium sp. MCSS17_016]